MIIELFDKEQSNKGYSLVEVIVAIIILAIVTIPLLTAFTLSAKISQKSKTAQATTIVAQSVMEDFKQTNMDSVYKLYNSGANGRSVVSEHPATPSTPEYYVFNKSGINVSGKMYDSTITVTSSSIAAGDLITAHPISPTFDFVFMQKPDDDKFKYVSMLIKAASYLNVNYNNMIDPVKEIYEFGKYTADNVEKSKIKMKRIITVDISNNPTSGYDVKNEIKYLGQIMGHAAKDKSTKLDTTVNKTDFDSIVSFVGSTDTKTYNNLKNIYLFYYPGYDTQELGIISDTIVINNTSSLSDVNVYLIKQKHGMYSDADLMNLEIRYMPTISTIGSINLHSNMKDNLSSLTDVETSVSVSGDKILVNKSSNVSGIFDIKVEVYEGGTSNLLFTLNGSMDSNKDKEWLKLLAI